MKVNKVIQLNREESTKVKNAINRAKTELEQELVNNEKKSLPEFINAQKIEEEIKFLNKVINALEGDVDIEIQ